MQAYRAEKTNKQIANTLESAYSHQAIITFKT